MCYSRCTPRKREASHRAMSAGNRPTPRRLAAACTSGVLALCASLYTTPAQAQTPTTLISNTDQPINYGVSFGGKTPIAQSFRTGDNSAGYTLHSVAVSFSSIGDTTLANLMVEVREDSVGDPSSDDDDIVADLMVPSTGGSGGDLNIEFTVPSNITLSSNTTYHLVLSSTQGESARLAPRGSLSESASGWSFPQRYKRNYNNSGWSYGSNRDLRMQVRGTALTDTTPPTLNTAVVNGNTLTLTYDEALDTDSVPRYLGLHARRHDGNRGHSCHQRHGGDPNLV